MSVVEDKLSEVLSYLEKVIEDRKKSKNKSYTSDLLSQGIDRVSQKVGEEAIEVVIASNNKKKKQVIYESADLIFHLLVLWKNIFKAKNIFIFKNDICLGFFSNYFGENIIFVISSFCHFFLLNSSFAISFFLIFNFFQSTNK